MWTRPLGDMLADVAGSLLSLSAGQSIVRATSVELKLPVDVKLNFSKQGLVFCADVPAWRWRTDFDPPLGQLRFTLEETLQEIRA
jgi:hypothetical protein